MEQSWPLVRITWIDSVGPSSSWRIVSQWARPTTLECVSVGYLIADDDLAKTIAPHLGHSEDAADCQVSGIMVIPSVSEVFSPTVDRYFHLIGRCGCGSFF